MFEPSQSLTPVTAIDEIASKQDTVKAVVYQLK